MKEKYDLSLDSRQVGSLLIGGIIVLGAVFVLGVVVGKKLATNEKAQSAPDLLSAIDQKADAATYTFQDELTKKAEPAAKKPEAEKKDEPKADPKKPDKAEKALAEAEPAEDPPPPPANPPEKLVDATPSAPSPTPTTTRALEKDAGLKEAITRVARPEASANGAFTLQLSASQSRAEADKFAEKLRDKGYAPYIIQAEVPGRGTWYRVRMGSFASKDAAARYLQDFKRETQLEAFVASNDEKR